MPLGNHTKTRQRCYSLIMSMILVGFSGSFAPYPFSALEGCHDGDVIALTRLPVNNPNPCNAIRMCCERRALSQKTEVFETEGGKAVTEVPGDTTLATAWSGCQSSWLTSSA